MDDILWLDHEDVLWLEILYEAAAFDSYHLPAYHRIAEARGEGVARLFVHREGECFVAMPLLVRPIAEPAVSGSGQLYDATSVYGYPGPIVSAARPPPPMLQRFRQTFARFIAERRIVTIFSRLNPLMEQAPLLASLGHCIERGATVSLDLRASNEEQLAGYRANHRRDIRRLKDSGFVCEADPELRHLEAFIAIYHQTMRRVGAPCRYFFDEDYFRQLATGLPGSIELLVCRQGRDIVAAAVFLATGGIVQYHLGGTDDAWLRHSPIKLVFDAAREMFHARRDAILHLGGGTGGHQDSLFNFKAGFSRRRHPFHTWQWIALPEIHDDLCRARGRDPAQVAAGAGFFPLYREP